MSSAHSVSVVGTWAELRRFMDLKDTDGCVVDADAPSREKALIEIRRLRRRHPALALVVYADVHESDPELVRLGSLGVDGVVLARRPPWASAIRRAVDGALAVSTARGVQQSLRVRSDQAAAALAWAVERAAETPGVAELAAALGQTPRNLTSLLQQAGLPSAARVLLWGRLLHAAALMGRDGRTVEDAALRLGYSTASALSRAMKRETGHTAGDVARGGGLPFVRDRLFANVNSRSGNLVGNDAQDVVPAGTDDVARTQAGGHP
ncbi:MAG: AraC family transcriptional regulator [Longimicrobiales bacterium]|nr:AraC family transcriptional regulator [Longimicrobiales bacterium]